MDKLEPAKGVSAKEYVHTLLDIVKAREGKDSTKKKLVDKLKGNAGDASLSSDGVSRVKVGPKRPTLREAVRAAAQGIKFDFDE